MFYGAMQSSPPPPDPPAPCVSRSSCLLCGLVEVLFCYGRVSASPDKKGWAVVVLAASLYNPRPPDYNDRAVVGVWECECFSHVHQTGSALQEVCMCESVRV